MHLSYSSMWYPRKQGCLLWYYIQPRVLVKPVRCEPYIISWLANDTYQRKNIRTRTDALPKQRRDMHVKVLSIRSSVTSNFCGIGRQMARTELDIPLTLGGKCNLLHSFVD